MIALALAALVAAQDTARLTLTDAVAHALGQYPSVAVARATRDRANADARLARASLLPRLILDGSATQFEKPMLVYPLHGFSFAPGGPTPAFDHTLLQASAALNWTLFDFGGRRARLRAARAMEGAADAALGGAESQLVARTVGAYLRALNARQVLAAQDERLRALGAEADRARRLMAEGKAPRLQVLRAEAGLARARAERSATAGQLDVAEHELAQLTGLPYAEISGAHLPSAVLRDSGAATAATPRDVLLARARDGSPEVREARRRSDAARLAAGAERAARRPEIRLQTAYVERAATGYALQGEWQAGLGLSMPLYTGGQRPAAIARADADARAADEQRRLAEFAAAQAVDRAVAAVTEAHARVEALRAAVEHSAAVAEIERTALEVGSGTQTDYLDALADLLRERTALIEARHAEVLARVELARVTGDLTPDWLAALISQDGRRDP